MRSVGDKQRPYLHIDPEGRYHYFRQWPLDVHKLVVATTGKKSTHIKRALRTADLSVAQRAYRPVDDEIEAEIEQYRKNRDRDLRPVGYDQLTDEQAHALILRAWLVWETLGLDRTQDVAEFPDFAVKVLTKLPDGAHKWPQVKLSPWWGSFDAQRTLALFTDFAEKRLKVEIPRYLPALHAIPVVSPEQMRNLVPPPAKLWLLGEAIAAFKEEKTGKGVKSTSLRNYSTPLDLLTDYYGSGHPITYITFEEMKTVINEVLRYLPKWARKDKRWDGMKYQDIAREVRARVERGDIEGLSLLEPTAIKKYVDCLTTFFDHCVSAHRMDRSPVSAILRPKTTRKKPRQAIPLDKLQKLFHRGYRPGPVTWIPLLCLYNCLRPNEASQLDPSDIIQVGDIWCLQIMVEEPVDKRLQNQGNTSGDGKTAKNPYSERTIPIHRRLIELGFLDYVKRRANSEKLFDVRLYHNGVYFYESVRKPIAALFRDTGVYVKKQVTPYALRHTTADAVRNQTDCPQQIREAIGGWSIGGSTEINYGDQDAFGPHKLKPWLDQIEFEGLFTADPPANWDQGAYERTEEPEGIDEDAIDDQEAEEDRAA